ncbi:hypothetical protein Dimus_006864 [Dionaea muscipula]
MVFTCRKQLFTTRLHGKEDVAAPPLLAARRYRWPPPGLTARQGLCGEVLLGYSLAWEATGRCQNLHRPPAARSSLSRKTMVLDGCRRSLLAARRCLPMRTATRPGSLLARLFLEMGTRKLGRGDEVARTSNWPPLGLLAARLFKDLRAGDLRIRTFEIFGDLGIGDLRVGDLRAGDLRDGTLKVFEDMRSGNLWAGTLEVFRNLMFRDLLSRDLWADDLRVEALEARDLRARGLRAGDLKVGTLEVFGDLRSGDLRARNIGVGTLKVL